MVNTHFEAGMAMVYGSLALFFHLLPIALYYKQYQEKEERKGNVNGGDSLEIILESVGIHIGLLFIGVLGLGFVGLVFSGMPAFTPAVGLKNFFMLDTATDSTFISAWMTTDFAITADGSSLGKLVAESFGLYMKFVGIALTMIYVLIPMIIVMISLKRAFGANAMQNESGLARVGGSAVFFFFSVVLFYIHTVIGSALVVVLTSDKDFSFFMALQHIWHKLLFGS
ncbi:MAG: hypothetical protein IE916_00610 [Epsilonproteobacteria bacterium]|nr:hypothetical protein [Campylobacterota bacterium]